MSRPRRNDAPGAVFHVTVRVNWQMWHLARDEVADILLRRLEVAAREFGVVIIGFALMSNHYHCVCQSPPTPIFRLLTSRRTKCRHYVPWPADHQNASVLSQFMRRVGWTCSRIAQQTLGLCGHFWDGRFHSRRLSDDIDLIGALAYDHLNPVRAHIVGRPEEYDRSSAAWWAGTGPSVLQLSPDPLPFGLALEQFRRELLSYQQSRTAAEAMDQLAAAELNPSGIAAAKLLRRSLEEVSGADPGSAAT